MITYRTKRDLLEALAKYPDDTVLGILHGSSLRLDALRVVEVYGQPGEWGIDAYESNWDGDSNDNDALVVYVNRKNKKEEQS